MSEYQHTLSLSCCALLRTITFYVETSSSFAEDEENGPLNSGVLAAILRTAPPALQNVCVVLDFEFYPLTFGKRPASGSALDDALSTLPSVERFRVVLRTEAGRAPEDEQLYECIPSFFPAARSGGKEVEVVVE